MMDKTTLGAIPLPRESGPATLRMEKGIFLMRLRGGYEEMGRQHAELARGIVDDYILRYYEDFMEKLIAHSSVGHLSRALPPRIANLLYAVFCRANRGRIGGPMREFIRGYTAGLGLPMSVGERAMLFPDILHYLVGRAFTPLAMPGCSGFFARGDATRGGRLVIGRNFDFFGRGVWNVHQCITIFHPSGRQSFLWVGALGIPAGGFGLNAAGIGIMMFTKFTKDVAVRGTPVFSLCNEIMGEATCLDDAVRIVSGAQRIGGLSFLVTDSKVRDAVVLGFSARNMEVLRPEDDVLVRTNHYVTDAMRKFEVAPSAWNRHSTARFTRVHQLLKEKYGNLTPADAVAILSDTTDPFEQRKRAVGNIVAATNNALSVVLAPDDDAIYIAHGPYPVCHSDAYHGFRVSALLEGKDDVEVTDLPGSHHLNETEKAALEHYEAAWTEHLDRFDYGRAVFHLRRAAELLPEEPLFHRMAGILLMLRGRYEDALPHLQKNAVPNYRQPKLKAEALLWVARCCDLMEQREQALLFYRQSLAQRDMEISVAAGRHINQPFTRKEMARVEAEFVVGGPVAKYA